jgi:hypothetical protein
MQRYLWLVNQDESVLRSPKEEFVQNNEFMLFTRRQVLDPDRSVRVTKDAEAPLSINSSEWLTLFLACAAE